MIRVTTLKEYIVWFEMKKAADGHEIYVCQKELK
jgi:hypothetical protein